MATNSINVLVLEDQQRERSELVDLIQQRLDDAGRHARVFEARDAATAIKVIDEEKVDVVFLDLADIIERTLPGPTVIDYLITKGKYDLLDRTVVLSAYVQRDGERLYETQGKDMPQLPSLKIRAEWPVFDVISKTTDDRYIEAVLEHLCDLEPKPPTRGEIDHEATRSGRSVFEQVVGVSPSFRSALHRTLLVAEDRDTNVLLLGESGTGKERLARAIHELGGGVTTKFVAVNMAAVTETLWDSEFFGIRRGVASGVAAREGLFAQADGGTLMLDEIGDMPRENQARLLRVLQEKAYRQVGGTEEVPADFRVISATDKTLAELSIDLDDALFWRLNHAVITLPPLRVRFREDPTELDVLLKRELERLGLENIDTEDMLSPGARRVLLQHDWAGNYRTFQRVAATIVRQLRHRGVRRQIGTVDVREALLTVPSLPPRHRGDATSPEAADAAQILLKEIWSRFTQRDLESGRIHRKIFAAARLRILDAMKKEHGTDARIGRRYQFGDDDAGAAAVVRSQRKRDLELLQGRESDDA